MAPRNSMYVTFAVVPSSCYVFLFDDITFFFFFFVLRLFCRVFCVLRPPCQTVTRVSEENLQRGDPSCLDGVEDMVKMDILTVGSVLHNLRLALAPSFLCRPQVTYQPLLGTQSRFGDKTVGIRVVRPQNGAGGLTVLKGLVDDGVRVLKSYLVRFRKALSLSRPDSFRNRFGDKTVGIRVVCPENGTAVL